MPVEKKLRTAALPAQGATKGLVYALVALQLGSPFAQVARADGAVPTTAGVTLDRAANGVPLVNIAAPNAAGLSHNRYSRFDVAPQGLILNNSAQPVNTQLGGFIPGNANLVAGSARLILNEVTAARPSQLQGYMEVAGPRAGVIVANPYGITCNGCGFLNTPSATLSTGRPLLGSDGSLQGFRVQDGRLRIEGSGLNARNTDGLALYSRVLELNAELYAIALRVVTGANTIDAATGAATPLSPTGTAPAYAIDSSALGGMYANTITLVGTEAGVGMRLAAPVAALAGQLEIRNNGDVRLARTSAQTDLVVQAQGAVALTDLATAGGNATFTVGGALENQARVDATGDLHLTASGLSNTNGMLQAGRNLTLNLPDFDRAQSGGQYAAGGQLSLLTLGDIRFNGDEFTTPGALTVQSRDGDIHIDSRVVAGGDASLRGQQLMLGETGVVVGQGALTVAAQDMENRGVVYGRDRLTLHIENTLTNGGSETKAAALLSDGDIRIAQEDGGFLAMLDNQASQIESRYGAIEIAATQLRNINLGWATRSYDLAPTYTYSPNAGTWANYYGTGISGTSGLHAYRYERITHHHELVSEGLRGNIVAAGDITITATTVENDRSTISASGHLEITADAIYNTGTELTDRTRVYVSDRWHTCREHTNGNTTCNNHEETYRRADEPGDAVVIPSVIEGRSVTLHSDEIVSCSPSQAGQPGSKCTEESDDGVGGIEGPWSTTPLVQPNALLPTSGLFHLNHDPDHPYLVETDPALNTYTGFLGSAYLLSHLDGWAPGITQRRLGDSYYELMLIRETLLATTGSRFLDPAIADEKAQFEYLMQNAIAASEALHLSPGIALSREQIDALQRDIVWMEERVVADQKVLVPVVYLAQGSSRLLREGAVIGGGSLTIEAGSFVNTGLVHAQDKLHLRAEEDILNRSGRLSAGGDLILQSGADIRNESGQLSGGNILVQAAGDITHRTGSEQHEWRAGEAVSTYTNVGATASVTASGQIVQLAGGDISLQGATVSGETVAMAAGGDITMGTVKVVQGRRYTGADWQMAEEQVRHLQTEVEALSAIRLAAGADLKAIAASLRTDEAPDWSRLAASVQDVPERGLAPGADITLIAAKLTAGGLVDLNAGGSIHLLAAEETDHYEEHRQDHGTFSDKSFDLTHDESRLLGSRIEAGGKLNLKALGDITLYASTAAAQGSATVDAGGAINVTAGVNTTQHSEQSRKSTDATFNNHSEGYVTQTAAASGISADGDLTLNAGGTISLIASELKSGQTLRIGGSAVDQAALALASAAGADTSMEKLPLNLHVGTLALTNESWNETQKGFSGPLEELARVASFIAPIFLNQFVPGAILLDMPEIKLSEHRSTRTQDVRQAGSTLAAQDMDIRVRDTAAFIGADVAVPGTLAVTAKDIVIDAVAETHSYRHDEGRDAVQGLGAELDKDKGEYRVAGVQETKTSVSDSQQVTEWRGTRIDAGNLILNAEKNIDILGSQLNVVGDAIVEAGGDLTIGGREGHVTQEHQETTETITVAVAVRNAYVDAALAVKGLVEATEALKEAKEALDAAERKAGLGYLDSSDLDYFRANVAAAALNMTQAEIAAASAVMAMGTTGGTGGFYASGSAQREKTVTTTTSEQSLWQGSTLTVGGNAALLAGNTLTVKGSDVVVDKAAFAGADPSDDNHNLLIVDAKHINLIAGEERSQQSSQTRTDQEGLSISANNAAGVTGGGLNLGYQESQSDSSARHYVNSHLTAGTISSRSEALRMAGAVVAANHVDIETGTLSITSLQDETRSRSKSQGFTIGGGVGNVAEKGKPADYEYTSTSGSVNFQKSDAERKWVVEQSGIIGHDSIRIAANDTTLTGALIANAVRNEQGQLIDQGKLNFSTGTLTVQHLYDVDQSKTVGGSFGVSRSHVPAAKAKGTESNAPQKPPVAGEAEKVKPPVPHNTYTIGATYGGHAMAQTTQATLGIGTIMVGQRTLDGSNAGDLGLASLNRDLTQAQVITQDEDIGGLNFITTIDGRWFSPAGRHEMADDQKRAASGLVLAGVEVGTIGKALVTVAKEEDVSLSDAGKIIRGSLNQLHGTHQFVLNRAQDAAQIEAHADGESQNLTATQDATNNLTHAVSGEDAKLIAQAGLAGSRDGQQQRIYVNALLTGDYVRTVGHEMSHKYTDNEGFADYMGWATSVVWDSAAWANSDQIAAYKPINITMPALQLQNARLLEQNTATYEAARKDHGSAFDDRYLNQGERQAIYVRALGLAQGNVQQAREIYARIASEALEKVDGDYAQQHTGTDPWAQQQLKTINLGPGNGGLFIATPAESTDTFLTDGKVFNSDEFRAIEKYGQGFTAAQIESMEKEEARNSVSATNMATGVVKSVTINLGPDVVNLGALAVDGYSQMGTGLYNLLTGEKVQAPLTPKIDLLAPLTLGEAKSLLVLGIPGLVEVAPTLTSMTLRVGAELATAPYQAAKAYQAEKAASAVEEAAIAQRRIELNAQTDDYQQYDQYRLDGSTKPGGDWDWVRAAPNGGAVPGTEERIILQPGTLIDRYGSERGTYTAPAGMPFESRALPPGAKAEQYRVYQVVEEIEVDRSIILPAFKQDGLGEQFKLPDSVENLKTAGKLEDRN